MYYCPFRHFPRGIATPGFVRLACLIHAANVRSEPGSNPSKVLASRRDSRPAQYYRQRIHKGRLTDGKQAKEKSLRSPNDSTQRTYPKRLSPLRARMGLATWRHPPSLWLIG